MSDIQPYLFQLIDVRLYEIHIDRLSFEDNAESPEEAEEKDDERKEVPLSVKIGVQKHKTNVVSVRLNLEISDIDNRDLDFSFKMTIEGAFESLEEFDNIPPEVWSDFKENRLLHCYGHLRVS